MMKGILECGEVRNLCEQCRMAKMARNKPCKFREESQSYCSSCIATDNALAYFKKLVIDENTRSMHEEIKNQFK